MKYRPFQIIKNTVILCLAGVSIITCKSDIPACKHDGLAVTVPDGATRDQVVLLAADVRPSCRQLDYQQREMLGFIHIGMNTFTGKEWGDGQEDPAIFNPTALDARKWVKTFRDAGITGVILVSKHHDGFCLWPSKYTDHNISKSPWRKGQGDVVRDVSDACKEFGMKLCIYLSPWDMHEPTYGTPAYNDHYIHQVEELLTNYGPVYLLWFDGAGVDSKTSGQNMAFDWQRIFKRARELQPDILLSGAAPDVRWVGNEGGHGRETEWSVQGISSSQQLFGGIELGYEPMAKNLGSIDDLMGKKQLVWYPSRGGLPLRKGWFWNRHDNTTTKSLEYLVNSFFSTIGQNSNLLPNLSPDTLGLIPEKDAARLIQFGQIIANMKKDDLASGAKAIPVAGWKGNAVSADIFDGDPFTGWTTGNGVVQAEAKIHLDGRKQFNVIKLQENVRDFGQRVECFAIDSWSDGAWVEIAKSTTIGFRKMLRLDEPVTTERLRVRFLDARVSVSFSNLNLYYLPPLPTEIYENAEKKTDKSGWKIKIPGGTDVGNMIDENSDTYGQVIPKNFPVECIIDLGEVQHVNGFSYTPAIVAGTGHIENYDVYLSLDGKTWECIIAKGRFGNIENNTVKQQVFFPKREDSRYLKLSIAKSTSDVVSIAEIDIFDHKNTLENRTQAHRAQ